jgi:hypothetical protein
VKILKTGPSENQSSKLVPQKTSPQNWSLRKPILKTGPLESQSSKLIAEKTDPQKTNPQNWSLRKAILLFVKTGP